MNYRLIAIAKSKHGTIQYAIIDSDTSVAVAVIKAKDGHMFDIKFLDATPSEVKWILDFAKDQEKKGQL